MSASCVQSRPELCPLCGQANDCQLATCATYKGSCWCFRLESAASALANLPLEVSRGTCLCRSCLEAQVHGAKVVAAQGCADLVSGRDYVTDEQGRVVFTAEYLEARGYCCGNGCQNCPW